MSKKLIVTLIIAVALFGAVVFGLALVFNEPTDGQPTLTADTNATPTPEPRATVIIDAGHGGFDAGAHGLDTGTREDEINLAVACLVRDKLLSNGIAVVMTRDTGDAIGSTKNDDMKARKDIISALGADATVSIHMNMFSDRSVNGPMVFYMKGNADSQRFAECMILEVCDAIDFRQRAANPGDYFIVRESCAAAVIVECGFLSNPTDEKNLLSPAHQEKLATGITNGIIAFLFPKS